MLCIATGMFQAETSRVPFLGRVRRHNEAPRQGSRHPAVREEGLHGLPAAIVTDSHRPAGEACHSGGLRAANRRAAGRHRQALRGGFEGNDYGGQFINQLYYYKAFICLYLYHSLNCTYIIGFVHLNYNLFSIIRYFSHNISAVFDFTDF